MAKAHIAFAKVS